MWKFLMAHSAVLDENMNPKNTGVPRTPFMSHGEIGMMFWLKCSALAARLMVQNIMLILCQG
jgi:hypothetical protein